MTKTTLTALGAALVALGQELQGIEATDTPPAETPPTTGRRGRPAKTTEAPTEAPPAGVKTEAELREIIDPLIKAGKGVKIKEVIGRLCGGAKLADLKPEDHAPFVAAMKKLQEEVEAEAI